MVVGMHRLVYICVRFGLDECAELSGEKTDGLIGQVWA